MDGTREKLNTFGEARAPHREKAFKWRDDIFVVDVERLPRS